MLGASRRMRCATTHVLPSHQQPLPARLQWAPRPPPRPRPSSTACRAVVSTVAVITTGGGTGGRHPPPSSTAQRVHSVAVVAAGCGAGAAAAAAAPEAEAAAEVRRLCRRTPVATLTFNESTRPAPALPGPRRGLISTITSCEHTRRTFTRSPKPSLPAVGAAWHDQERVCVAAGARPGTNTVSDTRPCHVTSRAGRRLGTGEPGAACRVRVATTPPLGAHPARHCPPLR